MISSGNFYLVTYYDGSICDKDYIVYRVNSLKSLFIEIIDLLGEDATVYNIEKLSYTDLTVYDVKESDSNEL